MRFFFSKETKQSIIEKFLFSKYPRPPGKLIWINGVSIGEAKSGLTIAKEFLVNRPDCTVLFSTSTISAYNEIAKQKEKIILIYLPIDIGFLIKKFIDSLLIALPPTEMVFILESNSCNFDSSLFPSTTNILFFFITI